MMAFSVGIVPFAFGCLAAERLPGPLLVAALADLGMQPASARTMLARMARRGLLTTERFGRVTRYGLDGPVASGFERIRHGADRPAWAGGFDSVVYDVPESRRRARDDLRSTAFDAGFGSPRPGLLIGLGDPQTWLTTRLREACGDDSLVETGRFDCDLPTARRLTARAWPLADAAAQMRTDIALATSTLERVRAQPPTGADALRTLYSVLGDATMHRLAVPALPAELLPDDWPETEHARALAELGRALVPALTAYAADLVGRSPHAGLYVPLARDSIER